MPNEPVEENGNGQRIRVLRVVRIALLGGVLLFGLVALYLSETGAITPLDQRAAWTLQVAFLALVFPLAIALLIVRRRRLSATDPARIFSLNIIGWAMAEGIALMGAVYLMVTGNPMPFVLGFLLMLIAFALFPIPSSD